MKLFTTSALATRYNCTRQAIVARAKTRAVTPTKLLGRLRLYSEAQANKLGPGRAGRPTGSGKGKRIETK